jgi:hypothetical protein
MHCGSDSDGIGDDDHGGVVVIGDDDHGGVVVGVSLWPVGSGRRLRSRR